jgi:hypothetical protein
LSDLANESDQNASPWKEKKRREETEHEKIFDPVVEGAEPIDSQDDTENVVKAKKCLIEKEIPAEWAGKMRTQLVKDTNMFLAKTKTFNSI